LLSEKKGLCDLPRKEFYYRDDGLTGKGARTYAPDISTKKKDRDQKTQKDPGLMESTLKCSKLPGGKGNLWGWGLSIEATERVVVQGAEIT